MFDHIGKKVAAIAASVVVLGVGVASAEHAAGGEWEHGNSGGRVWSNYWHPQFNHGSSVQGHEYVDSGCQGPGVWSRAQTHTKYIPWAKDGAYYRFC